MKYFPYKYRATLLSMLCMASAAAQDKPCKALNKANRKLTVEAAPMTVSYRYWKGQENAQIYLYAGKTGMDVNGQRFPDSVSIRYSDGVSGNFLVKGTEVASSFISYRNKEGEWLTDSIDLTGRYRRPGYYTGFYHSSHVVKTSYPSRRAVLYYRMSGADSFYIARYQNGNPELITWYHRYGGDSLTKAYDPEGQPLWHRSPKEQAEYKQGRLSLVSFDTLVNGWTVKGRKEYYASGGLHTVTYYKADTPVLLWRYYKEDGSLLRTEKKKGILSDNPAQKDIPVGVPPPEARFAMVEQMPEYPGGYKVFDSTFRAILNEAICRTEQPLAGLYFISLDIDADGNMSAGALTGQHAEALTAKLRPLTKELKRWKPGKMNGRPLSAMSFSVEVTMK